MAKMVLTYTDLLDGIKPSLEELGELTYSDETPVSHILDIAENLKAIEDKAESFWKTREKFLNPFLEKDSKGNPKTKIGKNPITGEDTNEFVLTDANKLAWNTKFDKLRNTKVSIDLKKLKKKNFNGAKNLKASQLKGVWKLLE
jgi:hypothetical protein